MYRGHFRLDQLGQNLNRYYSQPDIVEQTPIYAAKKCIDYYSAQKKLSLYLDLHAHASKRGCFIYGNVMDSIDDQVQNMLYCRLIALNTPNFDYEGCLFSREHMQRIDPGDRGANLTAEGSGRVATYLQQNIVHSYTLECNYNCSKSGNEVPPVDSPGLDTGGHPSNQQAASSFTTYPDKFTPSIWASVGRACVVAMMDIRGINPASRIPKSKHKTLSRYRSAVLQEVRQRKEYKQQRGSSVGSASSSGPNAIVDAPWRPRIATAEESDSSLLNNERFTITNAPMMSSDMAAARIKIKPSMSAGGGGATDNNVNTVSRPGGRPHGNFQRGAIRSSTTGGKANSKNGAGLGLVSAEGRSTVNGRNALGAPMRSSSAAAATSNAGNLDFENGLKRSPRGHYGTVKVAPISDRDPTPIASKAQQQQMKPSANIKVAPLGGVDMRDPTPIVSQEQVERQPFFSSGGGPNHPNYSDGSGTVGASGIRPLNDSRGSSRSIRVAMMHAHPNIQVEQQLKQSFRSNTLEPVNGVYGYNESVQKTGPHDLNDMVRKTLGNSPSKRSIPQPKGHSNFPLQSSQARLNSKIKRPGQGHIDAINAMSETLRSPHKYGDSNRKTQTSAVLTQNDVSGEGTGGIGDTRLLDSITVKTSSVKTSRLQTSSPAANINAYGMRNSGPDSNHSKGRYSAAGTGIPRPSKLRMLKSSPRGTLAKVGQLSPVRGKI